MSYLPSRRRRLLAAVAAAGTAAVAGCQSEGPSSDDGSDDSTADDDNSSDPGSTGNETENGDGGETDAEAEDDGAGEPEPSYVSPCDAAAARFEALFDSDEETMITFVPYAHTERYTRDQILEDFSARESSDVTLVEHDCERSEPAIDEGVIGRQFETDVSNATEVTSEMTLESEGTEFTDSRTELWVEFDGQWYLPLDEPGLEVTIELSRDRIPAEATGEAAEVVVSVVDERGDPVPNAIVIASSGSAQLEGLLSTDTRTVGEDVEGNYDLAEHQTVLALDGRQSLRADQDMGTIEFSVPSVEGYYVDDEPNPELAVVSR